MGHNFPKLKGNNPYFKNGSSNKPELGYPRENKKQSHTYPGGDQPANALLPRGEVFLRGITITTSGPVLQRIRGSLHPPTAPPYFI